MEGEVTQDTVLRLERAVARLEKEYPPGAAARLERVVTKLEKIVIGNGQLGISDKVSIMWRIGTWAFSIIGAAGILAVVGFVVKYKLGG